LGTWAITCLEVPGVESTVTMAAIGAVMFTLKCAGINPAAAGRLDEVTPLGAAAGKGIAPLISWLIDECGADLNATVPLGLDHFPLAIAFLNGQEAAFDLLLAKGASLTVRNADGTVPPPIMTLFLPSTSPAQQRMLRRALEVNPDAVTCCTADGRSLLHVATGMNTTGARDVSCSQGPFGCSMETCGPQRK
jgi:hypothetical protein